MHACAQAVSLLRQKKLDDAARSVNNLVALDTAAPPSSPASWDDASEVQDLYSIYCGRVPLPPRPATPHPPSPPTMRIHLQIHTRCRTACKGARFGAACLRSECPLLLRDCLKRSQSGSDAEAAQGGVCGRTLPTATGAGRGGARAVDGRGRA